MNDNFENNVVVAEEELKESSNPVVVSEDNIAKVNVYFEELELLPYQKQYIKEKQKNVVLQGYRKGKAPENMVARYFQDEARQVAKDNLVYNKYMKLLQDHKLRPLSDPRLEDIREKDGKVVANLLVDVLQPVVLGQYLGLEIEKMAEKNVDSQLKKTIDEIRKSYPKLTELSADASVETTHSIVADFSIFDGDKELEKQDNFRVVLGQKLYFKEFEDNVVGMKAGEKKEFDIEFPADYHKEDFRSRSIHFVLDLKSISSVNEYSDVELAEVLKYENEANMKEMIRAEIEKKAMDEERLSYETQILDKLLAEHQFKLPARLVNEEMNRIKNEQPNKSDVEVKEMAERFVRTDLILRGVYERHPDIHLKQEEMNSKIEELAMKSGESVENVLQKLQDANKLNMYVNYLSNSRVMDFLIEMATIGEVKMENNTKENTNE